MIGKPDKGNHVFGEVIGVRCMERCPVLPTMDLKKVTSSQVRGTTSRHAAGTVIGGAGMNDRGQE